MMGAQMLLDFDGDYTSVSGGNIDGYYGPHTLSAIKHYQGKHSLTQDGCIGPKTWAAFWSQMFFEGPQYEGSVLLGYLYIYGGSYSSFDALWHGTIWQFIGSLPDNQNICIWPADPGGAECST
jgi:hypothetical protein